MASSEFWPYGYSPLDELITRFFGGRPGGIGPGGRPVDIGRLLSEDAIQLLRLAVAKAGEWGASYLDTEHLLWAATQVEATRRLLEQAGADPDELSTTVTDLAERHEPRQGPMPLAPAAKRALLDARRIARATGHSYIGSDHIVLALSTNPDSIAGRLLRRITPRTLDRGGPRIAVAPASAQHHPHPGPVRQGPDRAGPGRADRPGDRPRRRDRADHRGAVAAHQEQPGADRGAGRGQDRDRGGPGAARWSTARCRRRCAVSASCRSICPGWSPAPSSAGEFEERLKKVMDEIRDHNEELIVFIDEMHTVVGAGGAEGAIDAWQHAQAGPRPRRAACGGRDHAGRVPPVHREGRGAGAALPAGPGAGAQRRRTRSRSCAGCATGTRRTTRCGSATRHWSPRPSCPTDT